MVGLTISMHIQQYEELKFLNFSGGACPRTLQKPKQSVQPSRIRWECLDFTRKFRIPTRLKSGLEHPDFEEQLSQANKQRNIFFVKLS